MRTVRTSAGKLTTVHPVQAPVVLHSIHCIGVSVHVSDIRSFLQGGPRAARQSAEPGMDARAPSRGSTARQLLSASPTASRPVSRAGLKSRDGTRPRSRTGTATSHTTDGMDQPVGSFDRDRDQGAHLRDDGLLSGPAPSAQELMELLDSMKSQSTVMEFELKRQHGEISRLHAKLREYQTSSVEDIKKLLARKGSTNMRDRPSRVDHRSMEAPVERILHIAISSGAANSEAQELEVARKHIEKLHEKNDELVKEYRVALEKVSAVASTVEEIDVADKVFKAQEREIATIKAMLVRLETALRNVTATQKATGVQEEELVRFRRELLTVREENNRLRAKIKELEDSASDPRLRNASHSVKQAIRTVEAHEKKSAHQSEMLSRLRSSVQEKQTLVEKQAQELQALQRRCRLMQLENDKLHEEKQRIIHALLAAQDRSESTELTCARKVRAAEESSRKFESDKDQALADAKAREVESERRTSNLSRTLGKLQESASDFAAKYLSTSHLCGLEHGEVLSIPDTVRLKVEHFHRRVSVFLQQFRESLAAYHAALLSSPGSC